MILWHGLLTEQVIELGPSGSFSVGGELAFTCWQGKAMMLLNSLRGKNVKISVEIEEEVFEDNTLAEQGEA